MLKTGFRKLSILSKFWKSHMWQVVRVKRGGRGGLGGHHVCVIITPLRTKIDIWLVPYPSKLWTLFEKCNCNWCFKIVWKNFYLILHQPPLSVRIVHHDDIFMISLCILFLIFQFNRFACFLFLIKIDKTVSPFLVTDITVKVYSKRTRITFNER